MRFLLTKWTTLAGMSKLALQTITDSTNFNIADNSAYMVSAGDDFFFMHMGKAVQAAIGENLTGRLLSEVNDTVARDLLEAYREAAARQQPVFMRFTSSIAQNALVWQRLVLPIPVPRLGTILVCHTEVLSHHHTVFELLFKTARHPGLVTYPIFNNARELDDGWVLLMNDAARAAFSTTGHRQPAPARAAAVPEQDATGTRRWQEQSSYVLLNWAYRRCRVIDSSASLASPVTEHCCVIVGQR